MVKKQMNNKKTALIMAAVAVAAGMTGAGIASYHIQPETVVVNNTEVVTEYVETIVEVPYNVTNTEYVNVSVENPINLDMESELAILEAELENFEDFLAYAEDKSNDLDLEIFKDAKDTMKFFLRERNALSDVVEYVESHVADKLEDEGLVDDEDEVDFKRAKTDVDEVEVTNVDFEDNQFEFTFDIVVKDDDETKTFEVVAEFDDGEITILDVN